jgi:hypothetical protein
MGPTAETDMVRRAGHLCRCIPAIPEPRICETAKIRPQRLSPVRRRPPQGLKPEPGVRVGLRVTLGYWVVERGWGQPLNPQLSPFGLLKMFVGGIFVGVLTGSVPMLS